MTRVITFPSDPLPNYVDRYFRLVDEVNHSKSEEHSDRAFEQGEAVTQRVVDMVAPTAAGILAQFRLLREIIDTGSEWSDDRLNRLLDSLVAGVEQLAAGGVA